MILSNDADAAHWEATGYLAEHGTATPGVLATTAAYRDARGWLDDVLAYLDGNRALLASADLPGLEVTVPRGHLPRVARRPRPLAGPTRWLDLPPRRSRRRPRRRRPLRASRGAASSVSTSPHDTAVILQRMVVQMAAAVAARSLRRTHG